MRRIRIGIAETATPKIRNYVTPLEELGALVEVLDWRTPRDAEADAVAFDGLVLCGGDDVDAAYFGEENHPEVTLDPPGRDPYEIALAAAAVRAGVPLLAVCRGVQVLNVALSGGVDQHVPDTPGRLEHRGGVLHPLEIEPGSCIDALVRAARPADDRSPVLVNSFHHQAVGRVAPSQRVTARAPDGVIEAIEGSGPFCVGVQWHPERAEGDAELRRPLFEAFVRAAARNPAEHRSAPGRPLN